MQMERSDISAEMVYNSLSLCKREDACCIFEKKPNKPKQTNNEKRTQFPSFKTEKKFGAVGPQR